METRQKLVAAAMTTSREHAIARPPKIYVLVGKQGDKCHISLRAFGRHFENTRYSVILLHVFYNCRLLGAHKTVQQFLGLASLQFPQRRAHCSRRGWPRQGSARCPGLTCSCSAAPAAAVVASTTRSR